jgi:hypothetical protein
MVTMLPSRAAILIGETKTLALHHQRPGPRLMVFRPLARLAGIAMEQEQHRAQIGFRKNDNSFLAVDDVAALQGQESSGIKLTAVSAALE